MKTIIRRAFKDDLIDRVFILILFLLSPFWAFLLSVRKHYMWYGQIGIVVFFALLGYHRKLEMASDAAHWTKVIIDFKQYGVDYFESFISGYGGFNIDYFLFLYAFSSIKYTAVIWSIIFALTAISLLLLYRMQFSSVYFVKQDTYDVALFFFFLEFIPFNSYGVKFWVALLVFLFGYFLILKNSKFFGYLLIFNSLLFHYSLFYAVSLFFLSKYSFKRNFVIKIVVLLSFFVLFYVASGYFSFAFLDEKLDLYLNNINRFETKSLWIMMERYLSASMAFIAVLASTKKHLDDRLAFYRYFLFIFALGLLPLLNVLDGFERYSRMFSLMTLLYLIRLSANKIKISLIARIGVVIIFSWHILVNFVLRKGEIGFSVFYQNILDYFANGPMTIFINSY